MARRLTVTCFFSVFLAAAFASAGPAAPVSRETRAFFGQLDEAAALAAAGRNAEAGRLIAPWLTHADTASRAARFLVEILPPGHRVGLAENGSPQSALLAYQALYAGADPGAIRELAAVLERDSAFFVWENSLLQHAHAPLRARLLSLLAEGISDHPDNPFLRTAAAHLQAGGSPPDFQDTSTAVSVRVLDNLFVQGEILFRSGQREAAERRCARCCELARQSGDTWRTFDCLIQLAQHRLSRGTLDEARRHLDEAGRLLARFHLPGARRLAAFARGMLAVHEGDAEAAIARFREVLPPGSLIPSNRLQASALVNLGYLLDETGRLAEALRCYQEAVVFYRHRKDNQALATALLDRGALRDRLNMPEAARTDYETVIELPHLHREDPDRLMALGNLANVYARYRQWERAIPLYQQSLDVFTSRRQWPEAALVSANLAQCHLLKGDLESALRSMRQSQDWSKTSRGRLLDPRVYCIQAECLTAAGSPEKALVLLERLPSLCASAGNESAVWELDYFRGQALAKLGRRREALGLFRQALAGFEQSERDCGDAVAELHFIGHGADVVEAVLDNLLALQEGESAGNRLAEEAFQVIAGYRARVLVHQLATLEAPSRAVGDVPSFTSVQHRLQQRQALACCFFQGLEYTYLLWLDGHAAGLQRLSHTNRLKRAVEACEPDLSGTPRRIDPEAVAALSRLLLSPLDRASWRNCQEILVLPDGHLFKVPFELLAGPGPDSLRAEPLGLRYPIVYLPAWQFLRDASAPVPVSRRFPPAFLGLHGSAAAHSFPAPLVWAEREVLRGAAAFPWPRTTLLPAVALAQPANRRALASTGWQIAHLATHIKIDEDNPWNSQIQAGGTENLSVMFTLRDLQEIKLRARLLILSGCASGRGRVFPGDGNFSLARAFLLGGCESILLTFWSVPDRGAFELMDHFYRELGDRNGNPGQALLEARRQLSRDPALSDPFFWAGYAFYGFPPALELPRGDGPRHPLPFALALTGCGLVYPWLLWRGLRLA